MSFNRIAASVKFSRVYTCDFCGATQVGDTERAEFDVTTPIELARAMENQRQTSHHMPVGWSYDFKFKCPTCLAKQEESK